MLFEVQILQDREGDAAVVAPTGRLDNASAPLLQKALLTVEAAGERRLVVDLAGVDYVSSAGLAVLFALAKRTREHGGSLAICALREQVRRVFDLAGYTAHFTIRASRHDAVADVTAPAIDGSPRR
jgi:anti-anti-sigma factor